MDSINRRKLILIGVIIGFVLLVIFFVMILGAIGNNGQLTASNSSSAGGEEGVKIEGEIHVWTYGLPADKFQSAIASFNTDTEGGVEVLHKNFASYEDYQKTLTRKMAAGESPDIILVPNNGGWKEWSGFTVSLGVDTINMQQFERDFHPLFMEELRIEEQARDEESNKLELVRGIRGIPFGFEPMMTFYNSAALVAPPLSWEVHEDNLRSQYKRTRTPTWGLGYGRSVAEQADIIALLLTQFQTSSTNYRGLLDPDIEKAVDLYLSFREEPNNARRWTNEISTNSSMTDMFIQGKVGAIIGYPSTFQDIDVAARKAQGQQINTSNFTKALRFGKVPQRVADPESERSDINIAKYDSFALTKWAKNPEVAKVFLVYLSSQKAQERMFSDIPYILPAQLGILRSNLDTTISGTGGSGKITIRDIWSEDMSFFAFDMGDPHTYRKTLSKALDESGANQDDIGEITTRTIECELSHMETDINYGNGCGCIGYGDAGSTTAPNEQYWGVCD